ncbi:unnamed protein product [Rangifer tarandus platyrhynchus]|uniref:Uncharacterized protein n=2 Tax=Rangifer tarandus platyrhynchus TaxID=3082113 RepID=A0ACB0EMR2_RANTA|nr:unnamed protein product [Rangifer tarandus platyrhynchus]CAI9701947.1 unnamed protein product [Rangifer tarandus platyrhynchus]
MHFSLHKEGPVYDPRASPAERSCKQPAEPGGRGAERGGRARSGGPRASCLPPGSAVSAGAPPTAAVMRREGWSRRAPARFGVLARPAGAPSAHC